MHRLIFRLTSLFFISALFLFLLTDSLQAQMFTVDDRSPRERGLFSYTSLSAGWEFGNFSFTGNAEEISDSERFDFDGQGIFKLTFENPGIDFYLAMAGNLTGMENQNFVNVGAVLYNNFVLNSSERFWVLLPLQISTDLTRVNTDEATNQFQQSSFQIGAGLGARAQLSENFKSTVRLVPGYGFSNSAGAFFGGTAASLDGKVRFILDEVFGSRGLIFGYDFRLKSYNIEGEQFDYDYTGHTISIGIIF
jgi:hypothetical protein